MERTRRETLALSGILLPGALAGCLSNGGDGAYDGGDGTPTVEGERLDYEAATIHVGSATGGLIGGGGSDGTEGDDHGSDGDEHDAPTRAAALVTSSEGTDRLRRSYLEEHADDDAVDLVDGTTFEDDVLLVVEHRLPASNYRIDAEAVARTDDDDLHAVATVDTVSEGGDAEEYLGTLLLRVAVSPGDIGEAATVTVRNAPYADDDAVTFSTA